MTAVPFTPPRDLDAPDAWRVPGVDSTTVDGLRYTHFTSENLLRVNLSQLLNHTYELRLYGRTVTVGLEVTATEPLSSEDGVRFKARHYTQEEDTSAHTAQRSRGWFVDIGPEGGMELANGPTIIQRAPFSLAVERSEDRSGEAAETEERNRESTRPYRYYKADVDLVITGPRGRLRVRVPDGLYFMVPVAP